MAGKPSREKIQVSCQADCPVSVRWQGRDFPVADILECWRDTGCWWQGESEKLFYRILCQGGGILEIFCDLASHQWSLYRVYD